MKRHGPPLGSGPGSEAELRIARQRSHTRSDTWHASLTPNSSPSLSKPTAPGRRSAGTAVTVDLSARGRSRFVALLDGVQIVKASKNPISNAARILHRHGYSNDCLLIARHEGAKHDAMHGPLGEWRKVRVRRDRGLRYVAWEPRPRRVGAKKGRGKFGPAGHRIKKENASAITPGAKKSHSPAGAPSNSAISDPKPNARRRL